MAKNYWLMKSEPDEFSLQDLKRVKVEPWGGVRNYQARNFMRDEMKIGDEILFYHSNTKPPGIAGTMTVASESLVDPLQFDKNSDYFDAKSNPDNPRWLMIKVKFQSEFKNYITLEELKNEVKLKEMKILQKGNRLSITPVSETEYKHILKMGGMKA